MPLFLSFLGLGSSQGQLPEKRNLAQPRIHCVPAGTRLFI